MDVVYLSNQIQIAFIAKNYPALDRVPGTPYEGKKNVTK